MLHWQIIKIYSSSRKNCSFWQIVWKITWRKQSILKRRLIIVCQTLKRRSIKKRSKDEKRKNKNLFNDKTKTKNRRKNIDEKKKKRSNHSHLICHKCSEIKHIVSNCLDLKKILNINAIFNKSKRSKISKKEKSSTTTDQSLKTKNQ